MFRQHDRDYSGNLDYNEWVHAMQQLGYQSMQAFLSLYSLYLVQPYDQPRLWGLIDSDRSGHLSEREFCEFFTWYRGW